MIGKRIFIIGAGTYGEAMCELSQILGYSVVGFYDDNEKLMNTKVMGIPVVGTISSLVNHDVSDLNFVVAIGNNNLRMRIMDELNMRGANTPTLIHPRALISPSAVIGKGVYIQANAYIWTKTQIGDYCIVSPGVVIAHHTIVGKACLISTLSGIGASIVIEDNVFIGMNVTIMTGVHKVAGNSIIGAKSLILKDTHPDGVYAGVPAKRIRDI